MGFFGGVALWRPFFGKVPFYHSYHKKKNTDWRSEPAELFITEGHCFIKLCLLGLALWKGLLFLMRIDLFLFTRSFHLVSFKPTHSVLQRVFWFLQQLSLFYSSDCPSNHCC